MDEEITHKRKASKRKAKILEDSEVSNEAFYLQGKKSKENTDDIVINESKLSHESEEPKAVSKVPKATKRKKNEDTISNNEVTDKPKKTINNYFNLMNRAPSQKLGQREIPCGREDCLEGLSFVITGILEYIERDDAINLIKRHGGKVTSAISKKTSYVVLGRDAGPSKLENIKKLRIKTLTDEELFALIEANSFSDDSKTNVKAEPLEASKSCSKNSDLIKNEPLAKANDHTKNEPLAKANDHIVNEPVSNTIANSKNEKNIKTEANLSGDCQLWVDKYKPKTLKELVGLQGASSPVSKLLTWLRNWNNSTSSKSNFGRDDGRNFKAALLSGQPGVGKTTSAILCCRELGLDYKEFNASDTRNKTLLKNTLEQSTKSSVFSSFYRKEKSAENKHVIIMDEVDGISGNQDRGGLVELVNLIKNTSNPIICICNDRSNQKIRTLSNYCFDLRFQKARVEQIKGFGLTIAARENIQIQPQAMTEIIIGANQDIRQTINKLQMFASTNKPLKFDQVIEENKHSYKDKTQNVFESARCLLNHGDASKSTINEKLDLFFVDYSLMPLFIQDNYVLCNPAKSRSSKEEAFKIYSEMTDMFALSTITDNIIRTQQTWSLLPVYGLLSCALPSEIGSGFISGMLNFPSWLGKNSTHGKNGRILDQLNFHMRISTFSDRTKLILDYIPFIHRLIKESLLNPDCVEDGTLEKTINIMKVYNFTREDWDLLSELQVFEDLFKNEPKIQSKILGSFTRTLNKTKRILPFDTNLNIKKTKSIKAMAEDVLKHDSDETQNADSGSENDFDVQAFKSKPEKITKTEKKIAPKKSRKSKTTA